MTKAGVAAEVAGVLARVSGEAEAAAGLYRAAMQQPAPKRGAQRIMSAVRLASGWVTMRERDGLTVLQPRYTGG